MRGVVKKGHCTAMAVATKGAGARCCGGVVGEWGARTAHGDGVGGDSFEVGHPVGGGGTQQRAGGGGEGLLSAGVPWLF